MRKRAVLLLLLCLCGCGSSTPTLESTAVAPAVRARVGDPVVNLRPGWNPVAFQGNQVNDLTATPGVVGLLSYAGGAYQAGPVTAAEVNQGEGGRRGFWVYASGNESLGYTPSQERSRLLNLQTGWNLVSSGSAEVATGLSVPSQVLTTAYALQPDGSSVPAPLSSGLEPGRAYWIFTSSPAQVTWGVATPSPSPAPALTSLEVTPAATTVTRYGTVQLQAWGTLANGSRQDVTAQVEWSSEIPSAVAVSSTGLATGLFPTTVKVTASLQGNRATASVTVTDFGQPPPPEPSPPNFRVGRSAGTTSGVPGSTGMTGVYGSALPAGTFVLVVATSQSGVPTNLRDNGGNTYQTLATVSGGGTHSVLAVCRSTTAPLGSISCSYPALAAGDWAQMNALEMLGGVTGVDVVQSQAFGATTSPVSPPLVLTRGSQYLFAAFVAYNNGGGFPGGTVSAPGFKTELNGASTNPTKGLRQSGISMVVSRLASYVLQGSYTVAVPYNCLACSLY